MTVDRPDLDARWLEVRAMFAEPKSQQTDDEGRLARDVLALLAEVDRLRSERDLYRDGIRQHREALQADYRPDAGSPGDHDQALWSLLDEGGH